MNKHAPILGFLLCALAGCSIGTVQVDHTVEPLTVAPVETPVETPVEAPVEAPAPVKAIEEGLYELTDFTMVAQGYTFDADTALTFMPFSSYNGSLVVDANGEAYFVFNGTIGEQIIETRSDTWTIDGTSIVDEGVIVIYYKNGQLQVKDESRASVDSITYTFRFLEGDA